MRRSIADWIAGARSVDPSSLAYGVLATGVIAAVALSAPLFLPDSASYVTNSVMRTPVYPLFLDGLELVFGSGFGLAAAIVQTAFGALCAYRFAFALRASWDFGRGPACALAALLLVPLARFGAMILPEALAYSFFLWFSALLFEGVRTRSPRDVVAAACLSAVLIITRPQYLFLVPVLGLYGLGQLALATKPARKAMAGAIAVSVALLISQGWVQRGYNYWVNDVSTAVPSSGLALVAVQLYLSDPSEIEHFAEGPAREVLAAAYPVIEDKRIARRHKSIHMSDVGQYSFAFNQIIYDAVLPAYRSRISGRHDLTPADWIELNQITTEITRELVLRYPGRFAAHALRELYQEERYFFLLVGLLPLISGLIWIQRRDPWWAALGLVALAGCANYALVVIVQPILIRYSYATDMVILTAVVATLVRGASGSEAQAAEVDRVD